MTERRKWKDILGLNARNRHWVYRKNDRRTMRMANDKLMARVRMEEAGIPMPPLLGCVETLAEIKGMVERISKSNEATVIKPNWGSGGRGVLFVTPDGNGGFRGGPKRTISAGALERHFRTVLSGEYSLRSGMDKVLIEHRVDSHPEMLTLNEEGAPDVRVLCVDTVPILAMARIPTRLSDGRANLHQGAIGVGLDLENGRGMFAVWKNRMVANHPDTGVGVTTFHVPFWGEVLKFAERSCRAVPLGYAGLDILVDKERGPVVLEINARPGLAIQLANRQPLVPLLRAFILGPMENVDA